MSNPYLSLTALAGLNSLLDANGMMVVLGPGGNIAQGTTESIGSIPLASFRDDYLLYTVNQQIIALQAKPGNGAFASPVTMTLTGVVTGSVAFDGSTNFSIATTMPNNSIPIASVVDLASTLATLQTEATAPSLLSSAYYSDVNGVTQSSILGYWNPSTSNVSGQDQYGTILTLASDGQPQPDVTNYLNQLCFGSNGTLNWRRNVQNGGWTQVGLWHSGNFTPANYVQSGTTPTLSGLTLTGTLSGTAAAMSGTVISGTTSGLLAVGGQATGNTSTYFRYDGTMASASGGVPSTYYQIWNAGNFTPSNYQAALGYTPVQQGTGIGQLGNVVKIGWDGSKVKTTIDSTDMGNIALESWVSANYASLSNAIFTGNVGIGTDPIAVPSTGNPVQGANNLVLYNAGDVGIRLLTDNAAARTQGVTFGAAGISTDDAGMTWNSSTRALSFSTVGTIRLTLDTSGNATFTNNVSTPLLIAGNGNGTESVRVGNDSSLWDINVANAMGVIGIADATQGFIRFGNSSNLFGWNGSSLLFGTSPVAFTNSPTLSSNTTASADVADAAGSRASAVTISNPLTAVGDGGTLVFGASSVNFAYIKGYIADGTGNGVGRIVIGTRNTTTDTSMTAKVTIDLSGATTFVSTIAASNFTGSSSGVNTGDQNLAPYALLTGANFTGSISWQPNYAVGDANALVGTQSTAIVSTGANTPTGDWATILQVGAFSSGDRAFQVASAWNAAGALHYRTNAGSTNWNAWRTLWDDGNFTPANYALLSGARFIGDVAINGGTTGVPLSVIAATDGQVLFRDNGSGGSTIDFVNAANSLFMPGRITSNGMSFSVGPASFNSSISATTASFSGIVSAGGTIYANAATSVFSTWPIATGTIANGGNGGNNGFTCHANNNGGSSATSCAAITFIRDGLFGCYFGIDTDEALKVGGWSFGNVSYRILHEGMSNPLLNGVAAGSAVSQVASSNTLVQRNSGGYVYANYFNTTANDIGSGVAGSVAVQTGGDGFIRWQTTTNFFASNNQSIGLPSAAGTSSFAAGTGDGASLTTYDTVMKNWWGFAISDLNGTVRTVYDSRAGVWYASDFALTSDRAKKSDIRDLEYRGALRPRSFTLNDGNKVSFGFVAQEVQEQYPEAVHGREGHLGVSYPLLTAILSHQINALERRVAELENRGV